MIIKDFGTIRVAVAGTALMLITAGAYAEMPQPGLDSSDQMLNELVSPDISSLEDLVIRSSPREAMKGYASYYASRFIGRRTTSGYRYHPDKMTAAHQSLPLGTIVRVVNPATLQEVHVTINDRCAPKRFAFIDLSRAAAKKIGLWGKGKIKVVIIPLLEEPLEEPA